MIGCIGSRRPGRMACKYYPMRFKKAGRASLAWPNNFSHLRASASRRTYKANRGGVGEWTEGRRGWRACFWLLLPLQKSQSKSSPTTNPSGLRSTRADLSLQQHRQPFHLSPLHPVDSSTPLSVQLFSPPAISQLHVHHRLVQYITTGQATSTN